MKNLLTAFLVFASGACFAQWTASLHTGLPTRVANNAVCEGFSPSGSYIYSFAGIDSTLEYSGIHLKSWKINAQTADVEQLPDLPDTLGKVAAGASFVNGIIYIIGGYHVLENGNELSSDKVHRFDVAQNQFIADAASIPVPIDDHVQAVYRDSLIFVVTGWSNTGNIPDVQIYNTYTNSWSVGTSVPNTSNYTAFGASGEILGDTLYYFGGAGGFNFSAKKRLRKGYINPNDPTAISWSIETPDNVLANYRSAACTTPGMVHWIGGSENTYNYDAVAYDGSGVVNPSMKTLGYSPSGGIEEIGFLNDWLPMDLRGIANISPTEKYLVGGIRQNQWMIGEVIKLTYSGVGLTDATSTNESFFTLSNHQLRFSKIGKVEVRSVSGQLILSELVDQNATLDLSTLPTAVYLVSLQGEEQVHTQKLALIR